MKLISDGHDYKASCVSTSPRAKLTLLYHYQSSSQTFFGSVDSVLSLVSGNVGELYDIA